MSFTYDTWYRENRIKYMAVSIKELHAIYNRETTWVFGLKSAVDIKVFSYFLRLADINGNVNFIPERRKGLSTLINVSTQQITNSLRVLKKENLIKGERNKYKILI